MKLFECRGVEPLADQILVRIKNPERVPQSNTWMPDDMSPVSSGEVISKGERAEDPYIEVGSLVLFNTYTSTRIRAGGEVVHLLKESAVLAKVY